MADETVIISNLPSYSPSGSDYLAVENDSLTGKASVDDVVGASGSVETLNRQVATLDSKFTSYLPNDTNIDNWITSGFWLYERGNASNHTGTFPISDTYGTLICVRGTSTNFAMQMIRSNSTSRTEGTLYIRYRSEGSWGSWLTYRDDSIIEVSLTAATNVTLSDKSKAYLCGGKYLYFHIKGKANAAISNSYLCYFNMTKSIITPGTFVMGLGTEWNINTIGYGFLNAQNVVGSASSDQWFHINMMIPVV